MGRLPVKNMMTAMTKYTTSNTHSRKIDKYLGRSKRPGNSESRLKSALLCLADGPRLVLLAQNLQGYTVGADLSARVVG